MSEELQAIIVRDKNLDQAVAEGLSILDTEKDKVDIEILDHGKRGFLGIGSRMVKVKLIKKKEQQKNNEDMELEEYEEILKDIIIDDLHKTKENDYISLENNMVKLKKKPDKKYPVVDWDENIDFYEDGKLLEEPFILFEDSNITYKLKEDPPENEIKITVSDDKMKAYLKINKKIGKIMEAAVFDVDDNQMDFFIGTKVLKEITPEEITFEDVLWKLNELNICKGIKNKNIEKALNNTDSSFLIAEGQPVVESIDAEIEYLYKKEKLKEKLEDPMQNIDYFSMNNISSVDKGEVVAVKHPFKEGKRGYNIYGEEIVPAEPKDVEWKLGEGINIVKNKAVAAKSGRPVEENGKLKINETYIIYGDVDIEVGNISMKGDVLVIGDVCENFKIQATGMIKVQGSVTKAKLVAGGDVIVKGSIINSELSAGGQAALYRNSYQNLNDFKKIINKLIENAQNLKRRYSFKSSDLKKYNERQIIQLLIDTKYNKIATIIKKFYDIFKNNDLDQENLIEELVELKNILKKKFNSNGFYKCESLQELIDIEISIADICDLLEKIISSDSNVWTTYIQSSEVNASGNVVIAKKGAYNTNIFAGNKVLFKGNPGIFRGGTITAENDVYIKSLGSPGGSKVEVSVPAGSRVQAVKVYSNVTIKIGDVHYKFNLEESNISAHLSKDEKLLLR